MSNKVKWWSIGLSIFYIAISAYLLSYRLNDVQGNLEASFISMTPAFVTSHVVLHRKIDSLKNKENISDN